LPGVSCGLSTAIRPLKPPLSWPSPWRANPTGPKGVASAMLLSAMSSAKFGKAKGLLLDGGISSVASR